MRKHRKAYLKHLTKFFKLRRKLDDLRSELTERVSQMSKHIDDIDADISQLHHIRQGVVDVVADTQEHLDAVTKIAPPHQAS